MAIVGNPDGTWSGTINGLDIWHCHIGGDIYDWSGSGLLSYCSLSAVSAVVVECDIIENTNINLGSGKITITGGFYDGEIYTGTGLGTYGMTIVSASGIVHSSVNLTTQKDLYIEVGGMTDTQVGGTGKLIVSGLVEDCSIFSTNDIKIASAKSAGMYHVTIDAPMANIECSSLSNLVGTFKVTNTCELHNSTLDDFIVPSNELYSLVVHDSQVGTRQWLNVANSSITLFHVDLESTYIDNVQNLNLSHIGRWDSVNIKNCESVILSSDLTDVNITDCGTVVCKSQLYSFNLTNVEETYIGFGLAGGNYSKLKKLYIGDHVKLVGSTYDRNITGIAESSVVVLKGDGIQSYGPLNIELDGGNLYLDILTTGSYEGNLYLTYDYSSYGSVEEDKYKTYEFPVTYAGKVLSMSVISGHDPSIPVVVSYAPPVKLRTENSEGYEDCIAEEHCGEEEEVEVPFPDCEECRENAQAAFDACMAECYDCVDCEALCNAAYAEALEACKETDCPEDGSDPYRPEVECQDASEEECREEWRITYWRSLVLTDLPPFYAMRRNALIHYAPAASARFDDYPLKVGETYGLTRDEIIDAYQLVEVTIGEIFSYYARYDICNDEGNFDDGVTFKAHVTGTYRRGGLYYAGDYRTDRITIQSSVVSTHHRYNILDGERRAVVFIFTNPQASAGSSVAPTTGEGGEYTNGVADTENIHHKLVTYTDGTKPVPKDTGAPLVPESTKEGGVVIPVEIGDLQYKEDCH